MTSAIITILLLLVIFYILITLTGGYPYYKCKDKSFYDSFYNVVGKRKRGKKK